ncbi:LPD38 domain-containing protein [Leyella stercorea]|uniref:LPD38 domain-containing protein n=1 Tax=Leyella stercorea TaxID=363265 RepID=UPI0020B7FD1C|nr:LPD38 domain-containing protein [Leyella stercorea]
MPLDNSKLKKVYATLQQGGYKQDYKTFLKGFTGNDHYENRKKVYDLLSANGARIGSSYEEFMKKMQVAPAPAKSTPAKPKGTPITEAYRQKVLANVGNMMAETNASIQRTQNRMDYARANAGLRVPRVTIGDKNSGVRLGQNTKVVAKKPQYNPKSGKMEQTYITESGNEFTDRGAADLEQNTIDAYKDSMSVSGQLRDAYAERDRLDEAMKKRMKEIDERPNQRFNDFMRESAAAMTPGAGPAGELEARMSKYDNDDEYLQLMAAARKNHQTIQLLEDKKNNQMNSFWHSLGTTALNGYTFTDGMSEMRDATALTRASKHIDSINRKRAAGKPLTREEQTAEAVLKNFATDNAVQGMYGGDYGAWARAGGMTANSLDFMKDLMLNPGAGSMAKGIMRGTAKGMAKGLAKVTGKEAAQLWKNNVVRRTLKATGVLIGAHTAGAYVSNTTGIGRTAATMGTLASGKVGVDDNGNYMVENAMGLLPAFAEAERQQARENGSEMFGEFIPGVGGMVKKGLEKIGLSKLSGAMTNIGNKEWYKQYSRLLESGGYNGLPGEALEEYEGSLFDALTGHAGDAWDDMTNLQNHVDIWLGCATMGALLGSVPMMMHGHHTALYYRYKHNTDKADNLASFRMTAERWAPLHDKIDNTDNSKMADVVTGIINNPDLHPEEKKAALNYVRNLTMMRGYNIAQVNNASDDEEQRPEVQSVNDNYSKGYDTTEPQAMNDAKNLLDMKREQVAKEHGIENVDEVDALIGDDPLRYIEEQKQLGNTDKLQSVIDYANAKSAYDGMVQRVQDDIDSRIEETNATVDSRVNRHDGMIHPASLKLQNEDGTDKKVYIVSGNVVMFDDGKGVDREKSDNTIVIRDVETGEMKVIPPDLIRGLDAAVDPEEEKARAREAIIEEMSQTAANNVDGVVSFNEGDTYTLTDENGEQTQVTLVANEQGLVDNGDGTVNVTVDGQNVVPMSMEDIQGGVDATNMARTVQAEQERQANGENVPNSDESVQNDGENVQETPDGVEYGVNDTFTFIDGEGATIHGEVQGISDDGVEIRTDEPLNGKRVQVIPVEEFENNVESINDADGNQVWAREYAEDAAATEEVSDSTEPLDHDLVAPATPTTEELVQMARGGNELAQHQLEAQGVEWEEPAKMQQTSLSRVPINEETGEPMFEKADRETALDALNEVTGGNDENTTAIVRAQVEQATKALEALKKKEPTKKTPSLKGSPMAMVKAQQEAEANYNTAMEDYNAQVAAAEENLNAWSRINSLMNDRKRAIREQQEAERKAREEKLHAEAVARLEEDKRIAAEKAAEQEAVGTHAVNPKIKAKWDGATKVEGNPNAITLADGSTIRGHYVLTEAGAATASHDVNNAYEPTEGFPVDENGESVNDRDYKRDKDAQRIVRDMADSYDSRALQTPVIVSKDGVVLSGNNRTMSGEIAAKNGTDKAYVDHLREFGAMFGFTPEQIDGMQHPRVVFVPDEELPYDASTFARFNAEQQKKQSKPEHAVKLGKIVPDNVFTSITNDISRFDRMSDYYADDRSVASAISQLLDAGVINEMQLPELRTGNALSAAGKELIENTLIGKVFQTSPDAVRQIISTPTLRQSVVMGLNEIANNRTLAKSGYDLSKELAAAVDLVSRAKSDSPEIYKEGMPVSPYGRQQGLFDDEYGDSRVTDGVTLLLADLLNSGKPSDLRKVLSTYNNEAASPAAGQIDMFSGDVTSKEEILKNVIEYFRNATPKEQQALIDAAVAERKRRAEAAEPAGGDEASEQATVVAESDAEPQQPVVASEEPVKGNEPDADALAKEAEEKLSERITDTEDEWTEPSEYGEIYKHRMFVDGKEVIKVDAPDKSKNYPGTYYEIDGKQFGDLYEVANYIDGNEQPLSAKIEAASAEVNTDPTEAQKEAGNYKKGHVQVGTFDITIEQPQGSVRKGTDADGKQWESKMNNTYGYIRGAVGVDGDHIDVFLSNDIDGWNGRKVFVVDQYNPDGSFDEHKVMLGFNDQDEAKGDYLANYEQGWENGRRIDITGVNLEDFEKWIESSKRKTKPFGEYSSVKKDVVEINTPEETGYSITPSTYTNKKGKTSDVSLLTFDHDLTADQERAVKEFAKERTGEGRFAPARGWKDRESGGWMFRSEEDARKAAEMVGNEEAVADNQPMTAQELRDAVEPKKLTTSKKTASKKPANRVESVPTEEPIEPEKPKYEVSDEEMNGLMNDIRDILGIGDDEGDAGFKFRDPDELTVEQRQKLMSVGQRLAMAMVERGNESFGNYASMMVKALGDKVRPWLKAFYGGLEYVPGYDKYALTPYEEVKAFDVENFDKPTKDVMAQANMIVEEGKAQVAAEKANNELKATRNEQRKETEKQTAANTDAVAAEAKSVASEATALAETSSDEQALTGAAERVDETLDKVNEQLALLGYYEADEVEKDYNEAYGYMRNAEKKAVKDAANLASQLISDLNLSHYEASHSKQTDKKGNRKKKPLAVSNISPIGGDVSIHLPLEEGRELYLTIGVEPRAAKGVDGFGGSDLEVTHIMFRVDHPEGTGNDRYGRNVFVDSNVTYSDLLKQVQREAYKYLIGSGVTNEGEYAAGDKVQYSTDGGRTWTDAVVVQPNDEGGIRIDTGLAPVMWVNAHPDQLRHKPSESAEPKHEAVGDFYEDGINEDAVAALPEDTAIQLHVVDILNPGMTDHSMKSKIESLNTLLPKISDKKLSELDKEYGDDKDMGTHIKAEVARRAKDGGVQPTSSEKPADKPKPASKKNATKKVKPEQPVGDLFAGLFDNTSDNGLQGNDEAVRTETVPADNSGQQQGLRESQGSPRKTAAQEGGRPDGGRGGQSTGKDRAVSAGLHGLTEPKNTRNNHSERGADHAPTSVNGRIEANIKAIELAHELLESGETATPEQMGVLRQFSGWGGLGAAFSDGGYDWKQRERNKKIRELLGEEAYEQAVMSANSAYYTPAYVVDTLWDIANQLGFKGGNILEGSAGIGNILGQMPTTVSERSNIHAIEIDGTSGGILSLLYPDAKVEIQGFEQTRIPNGSVDLAITNVPFVTGLRVNDTTGDSDLSKKFHNIHDFCIAKNVRKLSEGGLGIFISSNGTLDNSKALRDWVVNEGGSDFIGAFRMNNKTFGGTTVTSDIIVIRKRVNGQKSAQAIDVSSISGERTAEYEEPGARKAKQLSMDYNKYFIEHPDHMAGEMRFAFEEGDTFRPTSKGLYPVSGKDQGKMLVDFVKSFTEEDSSKATTTDHHDVSLVLDASADGKKLGEMYMKDDQIVLASFGGYYPLEVNDKKIKGHTKQECFTAYAAIKSALADVMQYQTENESDAGLKPLIAKLNKAYDAFVNTYGHFNKNNQLAWLRNDVDYPNVFSLETYKEQGDGKGGVVKTYDKADVMKGRVVEKESEPHPENVKDGVVVSMFKNGRIDVPYIASQLGKSEAEVKREIIDSGLGFEDPTTRQMEVSYQYLSGNVREKLKQAEANNENGEYSKNIKALHDVVPMNIPAHLIDFTLGSSWLDPKLYDEYVKERTDIDVHFTAAGGTWFMKAPTYGVNVEKNRAMGIVSEMLKKTIMGHELISAAIQNKSIIVSRTEKHYDGTTEAITDREATAACAAKIDEIRQDFKDWARGKMQSDADLSARMEQEYNDRFNNYVPMSIPDDFVPEYFGGATHKFKMRSHQGKAIVRGTMQPLLLAHEVGTGKTFTLISTAMEMRRLGTARKPMIVVQNATVGQFAASAKELYPNAKILTLEDNDRNAEGRKNFYAKIKYNDWDMIVVPQSTFEFIPDSDERQMQFVQDKIDEKMLVLEQMREADSSGRDPITRRAEKELADLQAEMAALSEGISKKRTANNEKKKAVAKQNAAVKAQEMLDRRTDDVENFDDMGIDALLIDEAHEYKHLGFATAMQRGVKGVDPSYSKKSQGVYLKTQAILEKNNGRNVIFATGTPISNTAAEIWTFMRYLMPKDTMKEYGIYYFDDFVRNFGNIQQMPEFNTSGKFKEVNRFAGYVNLPELVRIWSGVADTVLTKDQTELVKKIPEMEGGKAQDIYLPQTRALRSVMKYVREELERFDKMSGKEKKENSSIPLTMYGIAQGAAVDARLVEMHAEDDPRSKTNEAVRQTLRSLKETDDYKGTVAIFADHYQNKRSGFNLYEDIKKKLIQQGVPESEVIVMKPGMTIKKKLEIFDKVNRGAVRVILGSTATLGTGVNIQERLHTLIHLDAPNRPMDYTQRNGRILRQGNLHKQWNKPVRVLRFGVEDSLDVTAYQRLKTKGAIADSVMEGDRLMQDSMNNRVLEEEEDVFGDTVAQLSGSEYALLKNNAEKNVRKYESRKKQWEADQTYIHNAKPKLEGQIKAAEQRAEEANAQLLAVQKAFPDGKFTEITVGKLKFASVDAMADFIKEHNKKILDAVKAMKENPGNNVQTNALTLSLGGYDFVVKTEMLRETVNNGGLLFAEIHRRMSYSCPELGLNNVPVKQSLLRNAVEDITENVITGRDFAERFDIATRMVQHGKSELEQLKQREGKPFEFGKELEEAKRQFEEYSEAMKVEMAEKEKKYAEMDASVDAATDVVVDDEDESAEDKTKFRLLDADDPKAMELESLPESELVPVYRNVQAFEDDALGSPMAFTDAETGERRTLEGRRWNYSAPPKVELTEEQQRKLDELNKNGYIMVDGKKSTELQINDGLKFVKPKTKEAQLQYFLKKNPEDKGLWAAYDPYDHAIETPLNTQFGEAYKRPNLVVVRSLIPKSEIDEPFHADYALLPTGAHQWNNGRTLYLSRWSKIDKVLTREEEAKLIDEYWKKHPGKREELKTHRDYNRFVPQVRRELEKMGYRFELDGKELTPEESLALDKQNWESRDVIPGREGHTPFVSNEDIARINAKMAGKWVGEPKEAMESAMSERVTELSERLHTPVRIIRTEEEVAALPSVRQRRMKGSFNPMTGEVTIVVPNNANMADVENTFVHEVVGHDGLRVLFPDEAKLNNALDELYRVSKDEIRGTIDRMAQKMYDAEVDRIREKKRKEHVANGEDANASYYADMAAAHAEAGKKREQFKRDATEEYGADLAGRIGEKGFEKMSAEELTFWGKLKAMLQKALQKLLDGLKIPGKRKWGDKDWAFVLHEAYKRKKNGGKPTVFDAADTEVMRRKTGFGDTKFSDGKREQQTANERFNNELTRYQNGEMDKNEMLHLGRPQGVMRTFLPNLPIVMRQRVIKKGSEKKHEVDVSAIMNMPQHLSSPIFVFQRSEDTIGVLTDMRDRNGKNVCVAIELKRQIQQGAEYLEVNDVRSFHGREFKNIVEPIANNKTLKWVDKEKGLAYLSSASQPVQQEIDKQVLDTATKVVKDFVNPKVSDENVADEGIMFRDGDSVEYNKAMARDIYEQRVSRGMYQMQEALQDSMLGLKEAMDAILKAEGNGKTYIEDVAGYENAYLGENRLSSVNQAECTAFAQTLFKPMLEEVAKLAKTADERAELTDYMMAKHGLERNEVMARRAAEKDARSEFFAEVLAAQQAVDNDPLDQDAIDAFEDVKQRMQDREEELYLINRERDYAGLTALTGMDNVLDAETEAQQMVSDYERDHWVDGLWDKVNAVTKATLQKTYESGLINKATYDDISGMYGNYIPLRGFDDKTSDEAYAYLTDKHSAFNAPIKTAKGRKSKADDPFANMEAMAESAIMQGNRNTLVKQKFLNFALNHPSDLVSVSDLWLWHNDVADEWQPINSGDLQGTERIEEDDSPAEVERKMRDFEYAMQQAAKNDPAHFRKQKDNPAIPYRVVESRDLRQHQVLVKRNGRDIILTINGNPRAAQALNGQTNPDNDVSGAIGAIMRLGETINRQLSAFYTTRNPDFVVSNFMRDMMYANTMVWVKESPNYAWRFHKNVAKVNPAKMKVLLAKLRNGTLDLNDETEKMFHLFMMNGGETGYANIRDIEQRKNDIKRELKKSNGQMPIRKAWDLLGERLDEYNRAVENCARFAAFMTSRQLGRTIDRSVYDAKEISVNFNKKGSGAKFWKTNGQTGIGNVAAFTSGLGRSFYVFWNAALQGSTNFGRQFKRHPKKAIAGAAAMFLLGALMASIGGGDGDDDKDDKNDYFNLPEYVRRSNVVFRLPGMDKSWISMPLPVEYRAMYGMGELMVSAMNGKEHYTAGELAHQMASQVSQMLPIDIMEGSGGFKAFVPSAIKPIAEVIGNESWTGMPIYKDTPFNKDMPEWTKAYKSANKYLVGLSKALNEATGGDAYTSGKIDINPAQVEYLLNGIFGGVSSTIDRLTKMGETVIGDREYDPRSFLLLNRLVKNGDERTEYRAVNNEYFRIKEESEKLRTRLNHYENDTADGVFDYAEKIAWLNNSPEYRILETYEDYSGDIDDINEELKAAASDEERKGLEAELNEKKKELVDAVNNIRNGKQQ